ncbi:hypothetical protein [Lascolabacillus massiliensis]|uniref:hypothetical protein n=1 Tax=Lascolabacillus massiliensis TaxID=1627894 RepID=UPI0006B3B507|nr:hypothetical protein [Lascolabacillus massiliensis]
MHQFSELVFRSTSFTLGILEEVESKVIVQLRTSGSTFLIKNLQMIQLQKAITAVGMFSIFESILQDGLACRNGFEEARKILNNSDNYDLKNRFEDFICAINVLKHGEGRSYETLVAKSSKLSFKIKMPGEDYFNEGDVSEIRTLIEVNDEFVLACAKLIEEVSDVIRKERPGYFF